DQFGDIGIGKPDYGQVRRDPQSSSFQGVDAARGKFVAGREDSVRSFRQAQQAVYRFFDLRKDHSPIKAMLDEAFPRLNMMICKSRFISCDLFIGDREE